MSSNEKRSGHAPARHHDKQLGRQVVRRHIDAERSTSSSGRIHHAAKDPKPVADDAVDAVDQARGRVDQAHAESAHVTSPTDGVSPNHSQHGLQQAAAALRPTARRSRPARETHSLSSVAKSMVRFRHYFQFAIIIICLGWGGYQVTHSVLAQPIEANSTASAVVVDGQTLDSQYPGLPTDVAAMVRSVVATQRITAGNGLATQSGLAGSGVAISDTEVLTAGHNVEDGKGLACSQTLIVSAGVLSSASATKDIVTHASVEYGKKDDIAVLTVNPGANFKALPDTRLASAAVQPGETVYFVNFQPTAEGKGRSPLASEKAYAEPVIFSATVLGKSDHGLAVATGGGKSFGRGIADTMLRRGASGGAVVNAKGELVGLSVSSESLDANRTAASLLKEYDVNLDSGKYQVAYVQQTDKSLVSRLRSGMVSCAATN